MSKSPSTPKPAEVPKAPSPQNEYYYNDGVLASSRVYNKVQNAYSTNTYSTPDEKAIMDQSNAFIKNLVTTLPQNFNLSPESLNAYGENYAAPQRRALEDSYNQAKGAANTNAMAGGMRNSVGFNGYLANQLEKNKAQGLADIEANKEMMKYDLPNKVLQPYTNAFNLFNAALNGQQANQSNDLNAALQGSNASNSFALSNYGNQLSAMQAYNQQLQNNQKKGGNFFGWLVGKDSLY
jgi:hypothetical protein